MTEQLTTKEIAALKGELTLEGFREVGMGLFQKKLVALDPLLVGTQHCEFPLTPLGRKTAISLRSQS